MLSTIPPFAVAGVACAAIAALLTSFLALRFAARTAWKGVKLALGAALVTVVLVGLAATGLWAWLAR